MTSYEEHGYKDRNEYLECLADDNGVRRYDVKMLADILGESEDFDGLVTAVEDMSEY